MNIYVVFLGKWRDHRLFSNTIRVWECHHHTSLLAKVVFKAFNKMRGKKRISVLGFDGAFLWYLVTVVWEGQDTRFLGTWSIFQTGLCCPSHRGWVGLLSLLSPGSNSHLHPWNDPVCRFSLLPVPCLWQAWRPSCKPRSKRPILNYGACTLTRDYKVGKETSSEDPTNHKCGIAKLVRNILVLVDRWQIPFNDPH